MADILLADAKTQGYEPDCSVAGDDVIHGSRPKPFMIYKNMDVLDVHPAQAVVKVTVSYGYVLDTKLRKKKQQCWHQQYVNHYNDVIMSDMASQITGVSNHRRLERLLNRFFRRRSKKTLKFRDTGLCAGNSPVTSEFSSQRFSDAENVSIWWRHHGTHNGKVSLYVVIFMSIVLCWLRLQNQLQTDQRSLQRSFVIQSVWIWWYCQRFEFYVIH